jgi:hypothetical protein
VACIEGGATVSQAILRQRFDKIFYTGMRVTMRARAPRTTNARDGFAQGNTEVGRIIMRAAAEHLTPGTSA